MHTSAYPVVIFAVLVYLGVQRCFPRTLSPARLFVFPLAMAVLGALRLPHFFPAADGAELLTLGLGVAAGLALGWAHASRWSVAVRRRQGQVVVPGDPLLLVLLLLVFGCEFALHFGIEAQRPWAADPGFARFFFAIWGSFVGMSFGRAAQVAHRFLTAEPAGPGPRDRDRGPQR